MAVLRVSGQHIFSGQNPVRLKGMNLGGWLMMEGYLLHSPNEPVSRFKQRFQEVLGPRALQDFEEQFRGHFIQEEDFQTIASWGFNCIRVPFPYGLVETSPYRYDEQGLSVLDQVLQWAERAGLWVILDLHAACGAQNYDWHSDSLAGAGLWKEEAFRERTVALWGFLAERYRDHQALAGYDILNEPVMHDPALLNDFYRRIIHRIRQAGSRQVIFVQGLNWARDLACLDGFEDDQTVLSLHFYDPFDFTFHFRPLSSYPVEGKDGFFNRAAVRRILEPYVRLARQRKRPLFVGEFGINDRGGFFGESRWLTDVLSCFEEFGIHWTYWTYKGIKTPVYPDGLVSYRDNPSWVCREGPQRGWERFVAEWPKNRGAMIESWCSRNFVRSPVLFGALQAFL